MRGIFKEAIKLLGISIIVALLINVVSPKGIPFFANGIASRSDSSSNAENNGEDVIAEIDDVDAAKQIFDIGKTIFLDARTRDTYDEGHIKGAVSLPLGQFDDNIAEFISRHPLTTPIVTYCSGRNCKDSHELAQLLLAVGYRDIRIFVDGFPPWKQKGYPSE